MEQRLDYQKKRVLITGTGSYIGTSVEAWLKQPKYVAKYQVNAVDMRTEKWKEADFTGYDTILHVAGIAHVDIGKVTKELKNQYYKVNCDLALETAEKAKKEGVKQFIYMSSIIVYGDHTTIRKERIITKDTRPSPSNFYGDSKWKAEQKLIPLSDKEFHVAVLRPPMIYGEGCKGNYQILQRIALKVPIFPNFKNERSMCSIETLCEYIRELVDNQNAGLYFPQDESYTCTADMIKNIAEQHGKKVILINGVNWVIYLMGFAPGKIGRLINKAFGSLVYSMD